MSKTKTVIFTVFCPHCKNEVPIALTKKEVKDLYKKLKTEPTTSPEEIEKKVNDLIETKGKKEK